jgi:phosphoglycolate phosphatase
MDFKNVELLIFDLDYTMIDSSKGIVYCFNEARRRAGEPEVAPEEIISRIGHPIEETFGRFGSADPVARRVVFRKLAAEGAMAKGSFLLPGVAETIRALHQRGYRLAVASTKSGAEIIRILVHLGLADYFEACCGSDEVPNAKPAPDSLLKVMEQARVKPERTVYVGDHVVDIEAAKAAGVRIIALEGGPCSHEEKFAAGPDVLIKDLPGMLDLL